MSLTQNEIDAIRDEIGSIPIRDYIRKLFETGKIIRSMKIFDDKRKGFNLEHRFQITNIIVKTNNYYDIVPESCLDLETEITAVYCTLLSLLNRIKMGTSNRDIRIQRVNI